MKTHGIFEFMNEERLFLELFLHLFFSSRGQVDDAKVGRRRSLFFFSARATMTNKILREIKEQKVLY